MPLADVSTADFVHRVMLIPTLDWQSSTDEAALMCPRPIHLGKILEHC